MLVVPPQRHRYLSTFTYFRPQYPLSVSQQPAMASKDIFKHLKDSYARLTTTNYQSWMNSSKRTLKASSAWEIVSGREQVLPATMGTSLLLLSPGSVRKHSSNAATMQLPSSSTCAPIVCEFTSTILMSQMRCGPYWPRGCTPAIPLLAGRLSTVFSQS